MAIKLRKKNSLLIQLLEEIKVKQIYVITSFGISAILT
jgi:hypothetical protein